MTYDLSRGHLSTMGVAGGVNKHWATVAAAAAAAAIGGIWASILEVDPMWLQERWQVWPWLGLFAFPVLAVIVSLFLLPLYFMILRPAGHKDVALPVFAVFGAATIAMMAGLLLVSGPRALRDHDVFHLEDDYVRLTQADLGQLNDALQKAGAVPILSPEGGGDWLGRADRNLRRYDAEVTRRADAFRARRIAVRRAIAARYGDEQAGRDRMLLFDRQAAAADQFVTRFWQLRAEYGQATGRYLAALRRDRSGWRVIDGRLFLFADYRSDIARAHYELGLVQYDLQRLTRDFGRTPFIDRRIK